MAGQIGRRSVGHPGRKIWRVRHDVVERLGLQHRIFGSGTWVGAWWLDLRTAVMDTYRNQVDRYGHWWIDIGTA